MICIQNSIVKYVSARAVPCGSNECWLLFYLIRLHW